MVSYSIPSTHNRTLIASIGSTRVLCAILLVLTSRLALFDASPELLLTPTSTFSKWSSTLLRWDAFHYAHIAQEGYVYEYEWAFFPGMPYLTRILAQVLSKLWKSGDGLHMELLLVSGAFAALVFDGTFLLYRLTMRHFKSPSVALLTALMFILPSSPVTLRHAAYAEPFFAYLSYKGVSFP